MNITKFLKKIINIIDDPFDDLKHFWNGLEVCICGRKYKCRAHMNSNPASKWSITRIDKFDPKANRHIKIWCKED